jgi:hypothetical protein
MHAFMSACLYVCLYVCVSVCLYGQKGALDTLVNNMFLDQLYSTFRHQIRRDSVYPLALTPVS